MVYRYLNGLLKAMKAKHGGRFEAYSHTRMKNYDESGSIVYSEAKSEGVTVYTEGGHQIEAKNMIMATNVPLSKWLPPLPVFRNANTNYVFRHY